jgi:hypothetical protein
MWSVGKTEVSFWVGAGTGRAGAQGQGQGGFEYSKALPCQHVARR